VRDNYTGWRNGKATEFTHDCDSERGSSGSPVFNDAGQLVGLHHLGFDIDPQTCEQKDRENKAVRVDAILADIKAKNAALCSEIEGCR
jgi:V8-like Glu-specific endopeptidase